MSYSYPSSLPSLLAHAPLCIGWSSGTGWYDGNGNGEEVYSDGANIYRHGAQGILDSASNGSMEDEFGTHKEEEVIKAILEKGDIQESEEGGRQGDRNVSKGASASHR